MDISPVFNWDIAAFIHNKGEATKEEIIIEFSWMGEEKITRDLEVLTGVHEPEIFLVGDKYRSRSYME